MDKFCNFGNVFFKYSEGVRVCHHHSSDSVVKERFEVFHINGTVRTTLYFHNLKSCYSSTCRIRSVSGVRYNHFCAFAVAVTVVISTDYHKSREFSVSTGVGVKRKFAHTTDFSKILLQNIVCFKRTLSSFCRCVRVELCKSGVRRHFFVYFRIVLHSART